MAATALQSAWRSSVDLANAVPGTSAIYGITNAGRVVALDPATGTVRWTASGTFLRNRLTAHGTKLYCYRQDQGLVEISDDGQTHTQRLLLGRSPLTEADLVTNVTVAGSYIWVGFEEALITLRGDGSMLGVSNMGTHFPFVLGSTSSGRCVAIDGLGQPQAFEGSDSGVSRVYGTLLSDPGTQFMERAVAVRHGLIIAAANGKTVAYEADSGQIRWMNQSTSADEIVDMGETVALVTRPGHVRIIDPASGVVLWRRMYMYTGTPVSRLGASRYGNHLAIGVIVEGGPAQLFCISGATGEFMWQGNSRIAESAVGMPCVRGPLLIPYGMAVPVQAMAEITAPVVSPGAFVWSPTPLRGEPSQFAGSLSMLLPRRAFVSIAAYREATGFGHVLFSGTRDAGSYSVPWDAGGTGGFSSRNQFGRLVIDITPSGSPTYTITKLIPVNTLPDLLDHWARENIELMVYHQFISGYPDLTFKPDNLITRAETSAVIAKTLGLEGPSPSFQSKLVDINNHWARNAIRALEEREIISGFLEPDGTYTFRPELQITRAQEARILVKAFSIASAPPGYATRFTDVAGHWAEEDIKALEAAGFVAGFREADGSFTYRPEQRLTRAELCTLVVRIRALDR